MNNSGLDLKICLALKIRLNNLKLIFGLKSIYISTIFICLLKSDSIELYITTLDYIVVMYCSYKKKFFFIKALLELEAVSKLL